MFCWMWGSNPRPSTYQADAHPIELPGPIIKGKSLMNIFWEINLFLYFSIFNAKLQSLRGSNSCFISICTLRRSNSCIFFLYLQHNCNHLGEATFSTTPLQSQGRSSTCMYFVLTPPTATIKGKQILSLFAYLQYRLQLLRGKQLLFVHCILLSKIPSAIIKGLQSLNGSNSHVQHKLQVLSGN